MKTALVLGAGGFIGNHMVSQLKKEGYFVRAADLKKPDFSVSASDEFIISDLSKDSLFDLFTFENKAFDEIYQYAADMGGAGYIFSGENDANVMSNSVLINLNVLQTLVEISKNLDINDTKIFYSSSACIYPEENQQDPLNPNCSEDSAYPANPDSEYGWEKLFSERLFKSYERNYNISVRIARFHNIFGPLGTFDGGKEKVPAALCRKIATSNDEIEIWGDGNQTRSFLYIDECINATRALMNSEFSDPVNIGSEEMVSINELAKIICEIADKNLTLKHIDGPLGVRGRNSDNKLISEKLGFIYESSLKEGLEKTYDWISEQVSKK